MKVKHLNRADHNCDLLEFEVKQFREQYPNETQFAITSKLGDNNFTEGAGSHIDANEFNTLNTYFTDSVISKLVEEYPKYVRWRILCMPPRRTYSVHRDGSKGQRNLRLHIPVVTNPESFLVFYEYRPIGNGAQRIEHHNLEVGEIYEVDTTGFHTAVNYHPKQERIHIVAERFVPNE